MIQIFTDASFDNDQEIAGIAATMVAYGQSITIGASIKCESSTDAEHEAILFAARTFFPMIQGKEVVIKTDSKCSLQKFKSDNKFARKFIHYRKIANIKTKMVAIRGHKKEFSNFDCEFNNEVDKRARTELFNRRNCLNHISRR